MRGIGDFGFCAWRRGAGRAWEGSSTGKGQGKDKSKSFLKEIKSKPFNSTFFEKESRNIGWMALSNTPCTTK